MTRTDYLKELEQHLKALPKADYMEAMDYFTEYFDEAGSDREQEIILELGTPQEAAREIISNILDKKITEPKKSPRTRLQIIWLILLAICALPIGIPILLAVISLILSLILLILSLFLTGIMVCFALFLVGITFLWESLTLIPSPLPVLAMGFGAGLAAVGGGILLGLFSWISMIYSYKGIRCLIRNLIKRGKRS